MKNVFFVTVMASNGSRSRCWGYFHEFADAEKCVLENWGDIYELGYYNLAVIEEMPEGVCPTEQMTKWYKAEFSEETQAHTVTPTECPEKFKQTCNFSIG